MTIRLQYRLSTIFLVVTAISIFLGYRWHNCQRHSAVGELAAAGGLLWDRAQVNSDWKLTHKRAPEPTMFEHVLGIDPRDRLVAVDLRGTMLNQQRIMCIAHIPTVELVNLAGLDVSQCNLSVLKSCNVRVLVLAHGTLSKNTIREVMSLTSLEELYLIDTSVTDDDVRQLHDLPCLTYVDLADTKVSEEVIRTFDRVEDDR